MESASQSGEQSKQHARAERILDVAADLLLRWGYKRITIEDIAKQAGVGKGTVYLHWKTREALFETLLLRELVTVLRLVIARMRDDPHEVLLHRMMRSYLLLAMSRPLARAFFTGNLEVLDKLVENGIDGALKTQQLIASWDYFALLRDKGLVRTDMSFVEQAYALKATATGFFLIDPFLADELQLPLEQKADMLAQTIHNAFEPEQLPSQALLEDIAPRCIQSMEQVCQLLESQMSKIAEKT